MRRRERKGGGEVRKRGRADILITNDVSVRLVLPLVPLKTHHDHSFMILKVLLTGSQTNRRNSRSAGNYFQRRRNQTSVFVNVKRCISISIISINNSMDEIFIVTQLINHHFCFLKTSVMNINASLGTFNKCALCVLNICF